MNGYFREGTVGAIIGLTVSNASMRVLRAGWTCGLLILLFCPLPGAAGQEPSDGHPLAAWRIVSGGVKMALADGVLHGEGGPGWSRTRPVSVDSVLDLEFRLLTEDAEGAIVVRGWTRHENDLPATGYRIGLRARGSDRRRVGEVTGISQRVRRSESARTPDPPLGEWQRLRIQCEGDEVRVWVNGDLVDAVTGREPQAGVVGFEVMKGRIEVRHLWLRPLPPEPMPDAVIDAASRPDGLVMPRVRREVRPRYTSETLARRVEGVVRLQGVVMPDGTIRSVRVVEPLDQGLDAESVATVRRWTFHPATLHGKPVAVSVTFELSFRVAR